MKILVLAPDVPATSRMPGSPRLFNLCRELSRLHELFLVTYCSSHERYQSFLNDPTTSHVFTRVEVLPDPPAVRWWGQQWHRVHLAAHFETRYRHAGYFRAIRDRIRKLCLQERIDLIHVDLLAMTQYVDPRMNIPAFVDLHDSMTLLCRRVLNAERGWRKRLSAYLGLIGAKRLEETLGRTFDLIITNSTVDEQVIRELSTQTKTLTITNGVDMEYFAPDSTLPDADKIVFTGVMGYAPNEDAALHFVEDIFPLVKAKRPEVQFWIVGSEPSERVKALTRISGVHVTGKVDDVRPYVRSATVFVCPLRVGSGVKNKILAAMAMQKATVATSMSIDGLDLADNREVLLADEPQAFAEKVVRLLTDQKAAQQLGVNGLARVKGQYSWAAMGKALETAVQSVMASRNGRAHRVR
ncbi:MAG: glycosyltransferase [Nitrospirae bacterium]|nr:glycosyltransferase [Nitrospirota bacterium]